MTIWRGTSAVPSVGPSIHLKYEMFSGGDSYAQSATDAMGLARIMLRQVSTNLRNGPLGLSQQHLELLDYYFVLGGAPPSSTTIDIIQKTLSLTALGLGGGGVTLKITKAGDAMGYVNMHDKRMGKFEKLRAKMKLAPKKGWTKGIDVDDGAMTSFGSIHLDSDRLDTGPELSAKTLIHEATHKFASTTDFGARGYTTDADGLYKAPGLTAAEALNNAESYARFVMYSFLFA